MTTRVIMVEPDTPIDEVAKRLIENRISAAPVLDSGGRLVGIVSEGDLMRRPESETERRPSWWLSLLLLSQHKAARYVKAYGRHAKDVMTRKVITVEESTRIEQIAELLEKHRIKRGPVMHEGKLVGIVSRADLLHGLVARQAGASASMDDRRLKVAVEKNLADAGVRTQLLNVVVSGGGLRRGCDAGGTGGRAGGGGKRPRREGGSHQRRSASVLHAALRAGGVIIFDGGD
jgi:CBS domain-containing protein